MNRERRVFNVRPAVRERTALIVSITGISGTGKTFSAFRLATGIQRVFGGKIGLVDTEARRGLHYVDQFKIGCYVDFEPPFGPLDYKDAIEQVIEQGASIVIVDQLTHEHSGEGGVMDQIDKFLDEKCKQFPRDDEWKVRERYNMIAHARIKPQRKVLNNWLVQIGRRGIVLILLYRGRDVIKPMTDKEKEAARAAGEKPGLKDLGVQPETTSSLIWDTTIGFLLKPGADGRPTVLSKADTDEEKTIAKTPDQFRSWDLGAQLSEDLGERLARWAMGEGARPAAGPDDASARWAKFWADKHGIGEDRLRAAVGSGDLVRLSNAWLAELKAKTKQLHEIFPPLAGGDDGDDDRRAAEPTAEEMDRLKGGPR